MRLRSKLLPSVRASFCGRQIAMRRSLCTLECSATSAGADELIAHKHRCPYCRKSWEHEGSYKDCLLDHVAVCKACLAHDSRDTISPVHKTASTNPTGNKQSTRS